MPINLTALGGPSWGHNVDNLDSNQAREVLDRIQRHLSQNGKAEGTLTLFNRYNREGELTLERKSGFQLIGRGTRIRDTNEVLKTLLQKAGFPEAEAELKQHLTTRNGVGAAKMLEILKRQVHVEKGKGEAKDFVQRSHQSDNPRAQLESRLEICENQLDNARTAAANPNYQFKVNSAQREQMPNLRPQEEVARLEGWVNLLTREIENRDLGVKAPSFDSLLGKVGVKLGQELGKGAFGAVSLATMKKENLVLKTYHADSDVPMIVSNARGRAGNEAIAAYLTSRSNHRDYKVNVAQPRYFIVKPKGGEEHRMVTPLELRSLLKATPEVSWECVGLLMPKAKGKEVERLSANRLSVQDQKRIIKGTLEAVMKLNERGFIHRDLKPANMYFDASSGQTTLIDTGLMHKTSKNKPETRYLEGRAGTRVYMHPRMENGERCGTETDLYATAMMALELAHGEKGRMLVDKMFDYSRRGSLDPVENFKRAITKSHPSGRRGLNLDTLDIYRASKSKNSLTSLAVACLEQASRPAGDWADRATAQRLYAQLLQHPSLRAGPPQPVGVPTLTLRIPSSDRDLR